MLLLVLYIEGFVLQFTYSFFTDNSFFQGHVNRPNTHWTMPPPSQQPRPYLQQQNQQVTTTQGSALIAQLTQPPSSISGTSVNQFGQSMVVITNFILKINRFFFSG